MLMAEMYNNGLAETAMCSRFVEMLIIIFSNVPSLNHLELHFLKPFKISYLVLILK